MYDKEWISVKDRLPVEQTWVLAYIRYSCPVFEVERGISKTYNIKKVYFDDRWMYNNNYVDVTHWMPLPDPPKGE